MATWTPATKHTASFSSTSKSAPTLSFSAGSPIGLLLALTLNADYSTTGVVWADAIKHTATWTAQTKN